MVGNPTVIHSWISLNQNQNWLYWPYVYKNKEFDFEFEAEAHVEICGSVINANLKRPLL